MNPPRVLPSLSPEQLTALRRQTIAAVMWGESRAQVLEVLARGWLLDGLLEVLTAAKTKGSIAQS